MGQRTKNEQKILRLIGAIVVTACVACSSEHELADDTQPVQPAMDSVYNANYGLYVVTDDTTAYNANDKALALNSKEKETGRALSEYATKMLIDYNDQRKNTVLSPMNATMLYAMMANFVDDKAANNKNRYKEHIGIGKSNMSDVNSYYRKVAYQTQRNIDNEKNKFLVSNNMWMKKQGTVYKSFLSTSESYRVKVKGIDFSNYNEVKSINDSIRNQAGEESEGIAQTALTNVQSVVTSSLSFEQEWEEKFYGKTELNFKNADGSETSCKALYAQRKTHFAVFDKFDMVELPYKDNVFSLYVMLPHEDVLLTQGLEGLYAKGLEQCLAIVSDTTRTYHHEQIVNEIDTLISDTLLSINLPIFEQYCTLALNSGAASGTSTASELYQTSLPKVSPNGFRLDNVYQLCRLEINENGTMAKADGGVTVLDPLKVEVTTHVQSSYSYIGRSKESQKGRRILETVTVPFNVNRPFAIFIRENGTGIIPFAACVNTLAN